MIQPIETGDLERVVPHPPDNQELAGTFEKVAELLSAQGANQAQAEAYQRAADTLRELAQPVSRIYDSDGIEGLEELPGIGRTISRALQQMIRGGRWPLLKKLLGQDVGELVFTSIPNIGPKLARRIHEELGIETLAELQAAAWDGRLEGMPGMGEKRTRVVRESLSSRDRRADGPAEAFKTQRGAKAHEFLF